MKRTKFEYLKRVTAGFMAFALVIPIFAQNVAYASSSDASYSVDAGQEVTLEDGSVVITNTDDNTIYEEDGYSYTINGDSTEYTFNDLENNSNDDIYVYDDYENYDVYHQDEFVTLSVMSIDDDDASPSPTPDVTVDSSSDLAYRMELACLVTLASERELIAGEDYKYYMYNFNAVNTDNLNVVLFITTNEHIEITNSAASSQKIRIVVEGKDTDDDGVNEASICINGLTVNNVGNATNTGFPGGTAFTGTTNAYTEESGDTPVAIATAVHNMHKYIAPIMIGGATDERQAVEATVYLKGDNSLIGGIATGATANEDYKRVTSPGIQVLPGSHLIIDTKDEDDGATLYAQGGWGSAGIGGGIIPSPTYGGTTATLSFTDSVVLKGASATGQFFTNNTGSITIRNSIVHAQGGNSTYNRNSTSSSYSYNVGFSHAAPGIGGGAGYVAQSNNTYAASNTWGYSYYGGTFSDGRNGDTDTTKLTIDGSTVTSFGGTYTSVGNYLAIATSYTARTRTSGTAEYGIGRSWYLKAGDVGRSLPIYITNSSVVNTTKLTADPTITNVDTVGALSGIENDPIEDATSNRGSWRGIVYEGWTGTLYTPIGDTANKVTLVRDSAIPQYKYLLIDADSVLEIAEGTTLLNNGRIYTQSNIINNGTLVNFGTPQDIAAGAAVGEATPNPNIKFTGDGEYITAYLEAESITVANPEYNSVTTTLKGNVPVFYFASNLTDVTIMGQEFTFNYEDYWNLGYKLTAAATTNYLATNQISDVKTYYLDFYRYVSSADATSKILVNSTTATTYTKAFEITQRDIAPIAEDAFESLKEKYTFTGTAIKPGITLVAPAPLSTLTGVVGTSSNTADYLIEYGANNTAGDSGYIKISGVNNFNGYATYTFAISQPPSKLETEHESYETTYGDILSISFSASEDKIDTASISMYADNGISAVDNSVSSIATSTITSSIANSDLDDDDDIVFLPPLNTAYLTAIDPITNTEVALNNGNHIILQNVSNINQLYTFNVNTAGTGVATTTKPIPAHFYDGMPHTFYITWGGNDALNATKVAVTVTLSKRDLAWSSVTGAINTRAYNGTNAITSVKTLPTLDPDSMAIAGDVTVAFAPVYDDPNASTTKVVIPNYTIADTGTNTNMNYYNRPTKEPYFSLGTVTAFATGFTTDSMFVGLDSDTNYVTYSFGLKTPAAVDPALVDLAFADILEGTLSFYNQNSVLLHTVELDGDRTDNNFYVTFDGKGATAIRIVYTPGGASATNYATCSLSLGAGGANVANPTTYSVPITRYAATSGYYSPAPANNTFYMTTYDTQVIDIVPQTGFYISRIYDRTKTSYTNTYPTGDERFGYSYTIRNVVRNNGVLVYFTAYTVAAPTVYKLNIDIVGKGSVTPTVNGYYEYYNDTVATVAGIPDTGYYLQSVTFAGTTMVVSNNVVQFATNLMSTDNNKTLKFTFVEDPAYIVTYDVDITASSGGSVYPNTGSKYEKGTSPTFLILPDAGYKIKELYVDGVRETGNTSFVQFKSISSSHTIEAIFEKDPDYVENILPDSYYDLVTVNIEGQGTFSTSGIVTNNIIKLEKGSEVYVALTPASGYAIGSVKLDGVPIDFSNSFVTVESLFVDRTLDVVFGVDADGDGVVDDPNQIFHIVDVVIEGIGNVEYNGTKYYNGDVIVLKDGSDAFFGFNAGTNYAVDTVYINGDEHDNKGYFSIIDMDKDYTIKVVYGRDADGDGVVDPELSGNHTISISDLSVTNGDENYETAVFIDGAMYVDDTTFEIEDGESATLMIIPNEGYRLASLYINGVDRTAQVVSDDGLLSYNMGTISQSTEIIFIFVGENDDVTVDPIEFVTVTVQTDNNGVVRPSQSSAGTISVVKGEELELTFYPNIGYTYDYYTINSGAKQYGMWHTFAEGDLTKDTIISVFFKEDHSEDMVDGMYYIDLDIVGNGIVNIDPSPVKTEGTKYFYEPDTLITFYVFAEPNYELVRFRVNGSNALNSVENYSYTYGQIGQNVTAEFNFEYSESDDSNNLKVINSKVFNGKATSPSTGILYIEDGKSGSMTFTADEGYGLYSVMIDGVDVNIDDYLGDSTYTHDFKNVSSDAIIVVIFGELSDDGEVEDPEIEEVYTIYTTVIGQGSISQRPTNGEFVLGKNTTSITLYFDAADGYYIGSVELDGVDVTSQLGDLNDLVIGSTLDPISQNHSVKVTFVKLSDEFEVTVTNHNADMGYITLNGSKIADGIYVLDKSSNQEFMFVPNGDGFSIEKVEVDGKVVTLNSYNEYIFNTNNVQSVEVTLDAYFQVKPLEHIFTITSEGNGVVTAEGINKMSNGDSLTSTFKPDNGYKVVDVIFDGKSVDNFDADSFTLAIATDETDNKSHTLRVVFGVDEAVAIHTIYAFSGVKGTISPDGPNNVIEGNSQSFDLTPEEGYVIYSICIDDGDAILYEGNESLFNVDRYGNVSYTFSDVTSSHTIYVVFGLEQEDGTITPAVSDEYVIWVETGIGGYVTNTLDEEGKMTITRASSSSQTSIIIKAETGYLVDTIMVNGVIIYDSSIAGTTATTQYYARFLNASAQDENFVTATFVRDASVELDTHNIYVSMQGVEGAGTVEPELVGGKIEVERYNDQTVSIIPASDEFTNFMIKEIKVDGVELVLVDPEFRFAVDIKFTSVVENHIIEVVFIEDTSGDGTPDEDYTITGHDIFFNIDGYGSVDPVENPYRIENGTSKTFTFVPSNGSTLMGVYVNGSLVELNEFNQYTFSNITAVTIVDVVFDGGTADPMHQLSVDYDETGTGTGLVSMYGESTTVDDVLLAPSSPFTFDITAGSTSYISYIMINGEVMEVTDNKNMSFTLETRYDDDEEIIYNNDLKVCFEQITFDIDVTVYGNAMGTVTATNATIDENGVATAVIGTDVRINYTALEGYRLASVYVDGVKLSNPATSYTFSNLSKDHTISVEFEIHPKYEITASAGDNGSVSPTYAEIYEGEDQVITFTPDEGYMVDTVTVDNVELASVGTTYTVTNISKAVDIKVTFKLIPPTSATITSSVYSELDLDDDDYVKMGSISPEGEVVVGIGENQSFVIKPETNFHVSKILIDNKEINLGTNANLVENANGSYTYTFENVQKEATIEVVFEEDTKYTITPYVTNSAGGSIAPNAPTTIYEGEDLYFRVYVTSGYYMESLQVGTDLDNLTDVDLVNDGHTFKNISSDMVIKVVFAEIPATDVIIHGSAGTGGSISPKGDITVTIGENQSFEIKADANYAVDTILINNNGIDLDNDENVSYDDETGVYTYTFTDVQIGATIHASFVRTIVTVTATASTGGNITPNGDVSVTIGTDKSFEIKANSGYDLLEVLVDNEEVVIADLDYDAETGIYTYTFVEIEEDATISVTFEENDEETTDPDDGEETENVYIKLDSDGLGNIYYNDELAPSEILVDDDVELVIKADDGYSIVWIKVNNEIIELDESGKTTFTISETKFSQYTLVFEADSVVEDISIQVLFEFAPEVFGVEILKTVGLGTISYNDDDAPDFIKVEDETDVIELVIEAGTDYYIDQILVNGYNILDDEDNNFDAETGVYTFTNVTTNQTFQVVFEKEKAEEEFGPDQQPDPEEISITVDVLGNGNVKYDDDEIKNFIVVESGDDVTLVITPDDGSYIKYIKVNNSIVIDFANDDNYDKVTGVFTYVFEDVTESQTIEVIFEDEVYDEETYVSNVYVIGSGSGSVSPSGKTYITAGDSITYTIEPNEGSVIMAVEINGEYIDLTEIDEYNQFTIDPVDTNLQVIVVFGIDTDTDDDDTNDEGETLHTIQAMVIGGVIDPSGIVKVVDGEDQMFTFEPSENYILKSVVVDLVDVTEDVIDGTYTFEDVSENHSIIVTFVKDPDAPVVNEYAITSKVDGVGGSITPNGLTFVNEGNQQTFIITETEGYELSLLWIDNVLTDISELTKVGDVYTYTFENVENNHSIEVAFKETVVLDPDKTYHTVTSEYSGNGTVSPLGTSYVEENDSITFTVKPDEGYCVYLVFADNEIVKLDDANQFTFDNVTEGHVFKVMFAPEEFEPDTEDPQPDDDKEYSIYAKVEGSGWITPSGIVKVEENGSVTFDYDAFEGYVITGVYVNGEKVENPGNSYTFDDVESNGTIFVYIDVDSDEDDFIEFEITASAGENGTITPIDTTKVKAGSSVDYIISPNEGYAILSVIVNDVDVTDKVVNGVYTFENVSENLKIHVEFGDDVDGDGLVDVIYTIIPTASAGGSINPNQAVTVIEGNTYKFGFVADSGFAVERVTITSNGIPTDVTADVVASAYTFAPVYADYEIYVEFTQNTYKLTTEVIEISDGEFGGTISPNGTEYVTLGTDKVYEIKAYADYVIKSITVNGDEVTEFDSATQHELALNNIQDHAEIIVEFAPVKKFTITATSGENGSINPETTTVNAGGTAVVTFTPETGYRVASVTIGDDVVNVGSDLFYIFSDVNDNYEIHVEFEIIPTNPTITTNVMGGLGSITPAGPLEVIYGSNQKFDFEAEEGYEIVAIIVGNQQVDIDDSITLVNVTEDTSITVVFGEKKADDDGNTDVGPQPQVTEYTVTVIDTVGGSVSPGTKDYEEGTENVTYSFTPDENYAIDYVTITKGDGKVVTITDSAFTFAEIDDDYTIEVTFKEVVIDDSVEYTITSSVNGGNGSISPEGETTVNKNENVTFEFTPDVGYRVTQIKINEQTIDIVGIDSYTITVTDDEMTFEVVFGKTPDDDDDNNDDNTTNPETNEFKITASALNGGSISPSGEITYNKGDDAVYTITADLGSKLMFVLIDGNPIDLNTDTNYKAETGEYTFSNISASSTIVAFFTDDDTDRDEDDVYYTISASADTGAIISPTGLVPVLKGEDKTFEISAIEGYEITEVLVNGDVVTIKNGTYTFTNVKDDYTIVVKAVKIAQDGNFVISATTSGNGTIDPSGSKEYEADTTETYTATATTGYYISKVVIDDAIVVIDDGITEFSYEFKNISDNHTIHVEFTLIEVPTAPEQWYVDATAGVNGSITNPGITWFDKDTENVTYTFTPETGYMIDTVSVDGSEVPVSGNYYTFPVIDKNYAIEVTFKLIPAGTEKVTITSSVYNGGGSISPSGEKEVYIGTFVEYTFTPNENYQVSLVTIYYANSYEVVAIDNISKYTVEVIEDGMQIVVEYEEVKNNGTDPDAPDEPTVPEVETTYDVVANVNGVGGTISPSGTETYNEGTTDVTYVITPKNGYVVDVVTITKGDGTVVTTTNNFYTFDEIDDDYVIEVTFKEIEIDDSVEYTITSSVNGENGSISPEGETTVNKNENVTFEFTPDDGYRVTQIKINEQTIDIVGIDSYTVTVTDDEMTFEVVFGKIPDTDDDNSTGGGTGSGGSGGSGGSTGGLGGSTGGGTTGGTTVSPETNDVTLTYASNGGTYFGSETFEANTKVYITNTPRRDGFIFVGWYFDTDFTDPVSSFVIIDDTTIYAKYEKYVVSDLLESDNHYAYIVGYEDGSVRPNGYITRAEVATILFRLLDDSVRSQYLTRANNFGDVNSDNWYEMAVSTLANLGIIEGRLDGSFDGDAPITRAEVATMISRLIGNTAYNGNGFTDVNSHWAYDYIINIQGYGIIEGYEDGSFAPDANITRAETITMANRLTNRNSIDVEYLAPNKLMFTDNVDTASWYYSAIILSANTFTYCLDSDGFIMSTDIVDGFDWLTYEVIS